MQQKPPRPIVLITEQKAADVLNLCSTCSREIYHGPPVFKSALKSNVQNKHVGSVACRDDCPTQFCTSRTVSSLDHISCYTGFYVNNQYHITVNCSWLTANLITTWWWSQQGYGLSLIELCLYSLWLFSRSCAGWLDGATGQNLFLPLEIYF